MGAVTSPVAWDLTVAGLPAAVKSAGIVPDADGFYYKAGRFVEIVADQTVGPATTAQAAIGIFEDSITIKTNPRGLDNRTRVTVLPFGFRRILYMTAEGDLTAGTWVTQGATNKNAVKAASAMTVTPDAGDTNLTGSAAKPSLAVAGGIPAERTLGVIWKGATNGNEVEVLAY